MQLYLVELTLNKRIPKRLFERIKSLQCYELTMSLSLLVSPLTYAVWFGYCKCGLMQKQSRIFNYHQFQDMKLLYVVWILHTKVGIARARRNRARI